MVIRRHPEPDRFDSSKFSEPYIIHGRPWMLNSISMITPSAAIRKKWTYDSFEQVITSGTNRPPISHKSVKFAFEGLWSHIYHRTSAALDDRFDISHTTVFVFMNCVIQEIHSETEVAEADVTVGLDEYVTGLDIAMKDVMLVEKNNGSTLVFIISAPNYVE
jgi:hypothetical protein